MKYHTTFIKKYSETDHILSVNLIPENEKEESLLRSYKNDIFFEKHYEKAINLYEKDYSFLKVTNMSLWPDAAQVLVRIS